MASRISRNEKFPGPENACPGRGPFDSIRVAPKVSDSGDSCAKPSRARDIRRQRRVDEKNERSGQPVTFEIRNVRTFEKTDFDEI